MKTLQTILTCIIIATPLYSTEFGLDLWVFPGASFKEKGSPYIESSYPDGRVEKWHTDFGQYVTDRSFHEVLAFDIEKSRVNPPNDSIVGREFPGTDVFIPAHWVTRGELGNDSVVTLLHFIREGCATAVFTIVNHPDLGSLTVVLSRGKDEKQTVIQLVRNPTAPDTTTKAGRDSTGQPAARGDEAVSSEKPKLETEEGSQ